MTEEDPELQSDAQEDGEAPKLVRKPWHAPQFMMSNIDGTNHGTISFADGVGSSS